MKLRNILIVLAVACCSGLRALALYRWRQRVRGLKPLWQIERSDFAPGLHVRWPFETVQHLDRRLVLQTLPGENVLTAEKKSLIVDLLVRWRIKDPVAFILATDGNEDLAGQQLGSALMASLKRMFSERSLAQIVAADPASLTAAALAQANSTLGQLGVVVQDVSLERAELPDDLRTLPISACRRSSRRRPSSCGAMPARRSPRRAPIPSRSATRSLQTPRAMPSAFAVRARLRPRWCTRVAMDATSSLAPFIAASKPTHRAGARRRYSGDRARRGFFKYLHIRASADGSVCHRDWYPVGDEGKGKLVDLLTERASAVTRFQGGHNAGHTLVIGGRKTILSLILPESCAMACAV